MNLYINPDNQKLLWNIINNNPFITHFFYTLPSNEKQLWFKHIIEKIYIENQHKIITYESLKELNKATLTFMLQDIKNKQNPSVQPIQREPPNQINTPPIVKDNKSDILSDIDILNNKVYKDKDFSFIEYTKYLNLGCVKNVKSNKYLKFPVGLQKYNKMIKNKNTLRINNVDIDTLHLLKEITKNKKNKDYKILIKKMNNSLKILTI